MEKKSTYDDISGITGFPYDRIKKEGAGMWKYITEAIGKNINKKDCKFKLTHHIQQENNKNKLIIPNPKVPIILESPNLPVPLDSNFYIARKEESFAYQTIEELGAVIRIVGTRKSGATSLIGRITHHAKLFGDRLVVVNFKGIEEEALTSIQSLTK